MKNYGTTMRRTRRILVLSCLLTALVASARPGAPRQDSLPEAARPKVGLVLSGGGAKGFAHLGAIKVIEQAGVHIDYIGGTSIGAIVGGLYAAGWTTEQIDSLIQDFDMMTLIQDKVERRYRTYYDKRQDGKIWFRLGIKDGGKLQFPSAISHGQNLINMLADWTVPVHSVTDFDSLRIPYFAKATDLSRGRSVRLDKGYLPEAMRASGTFPSLLTPFTIDSLLLVDGGVLDNYPVDQMREMGADIVIGVNINSGLSTPDKLGSIVGILDQIIGFQIVENVERQSGRVDLEIKPDIAEFNVMSFEQADSIYLRGVSAARDHLADLQRIARMQQGGGISGKAQAKMAHPAEFPVEDIRVEGAENYPKDYFLDRVDKDLPSRFTLGDIHRAVSRLYATDNFLNVYYRLLPGSAPGRYVLQFVARENPVHRYAGVSWGYDRLYGINLLLNLRINSRTRPGIFETDVVLGQSPSLRLSLYRDNGRRISLGANFKLGRFDTQANFTDIAVGAPEQRPFKLRTDIVNEYVQGNVYAQTVINQLFTCGVGLEYLCLKSSIDNFSYVGHGSLDFENTYFFAPNVYVAGDTRNDRFFPTRGFYFNAMYKALFSPGTRLSVVDPARGDFQSFLTVQAEHSWSLGARFAVTAGTYLGLSMCDKLPFAYRFFPGGTRVAMPFNYIRFYGLPLMWNNDRSTTDIGQNNLLKVGVKLQYSPLRNQYLTAVYNYGLTSIDRTAFRASYRQINGAGLGYAIGTPLGKLQLIGTYSPDKKTGSHFGLFFSAGYTF